MRYKTNGRPLTTMRRVKRKRSLVDRILRKNEKSNYKILGAITIGMAITMINGMNQGTKNLEDSLRLAKMQQTHIVTEEEKWRESLRYDVNAQEAQQEKEEIKIENVLSNVVEQYNQNAAQYGEQTITENDIKIYEEMGINDGQIFSQYSDSGELEYHQNYLKQNDGTVNWVAKENIDGAYAIVNGLDNTAIAGIINLNGEYEPLKVDLMKTASNQDIIASDNYITIEGNKEVYDSLKNEAQKRIKEQEDKSKGIENEM